MMERLTTVKTTATRSRSERLNASRNKQAGDEEDEKQKSGCFSAKTCNKWEEQKKDSPRNLLGERKLVGSKQR